MLMYHCITEGQGQNNQFGWIKIGAHVLGYKACIDEWWISFENQLWIVYIIVVESLYNGTNFCNLRTITNDHQIACQRWKIYINRSCSKFLFDNENWLLLEINVIYMYTSPSEIFKHVVQGGTNLASTMNISSYKKINHVHNFCSSIDEMCLYQNIFFQWCYPTWMM